MAEMTTRRKPETANTMYGNAHQVAAAYKKIHTNLMFTLAATSGRTVLFSGVGAGTGKSTLCANLAIATAQAGARVLLVDGDMRHPVQQRNFRITSQMGLSTILCGKYRVEECLCREVKPNLDVLPAGILPPNPEALLALPRRKKLMAALEEAYDYVFVDMPVWGEGEDVLLVAPSAAGVVLAARSGRTTYRDLGRVADGIAEAGSQVLGVILSGQS